MELNLKAPEPEAPAHRQFVKVAYKLGATRLYTFHNDGPPLAIGDRPAVDEARGDGWQRVEVVELLAEKPTFPTKGIRFDLGVEPLPAVRSGLAGLDISGVA